MFLYIHIIVKAESQRNGKITPVFPLADFPMSHLVSVFIGVRNVPYILSMNVKHSKVKAALVHHNASIA